MNNDLSKELEVAIDAAKKASVLLLSYYKSEDIGEIVSKGLVDRASDADFKSEELIIKILESTFPEYNINGEESGNNNRKSEYTWYVDPLCGSNDFIHGFPEFGLSIALIFKEEVVLGVCGLPVFGEVYWAKKGSGAFLNGDKIFVSKTKALHDSIITTHISAKVTDIVPSIELMKKFAGSYIKVPGSFPYAVCNLARGRSDIHAELNVVGIHSLAASFIATEAGGKQSKVSGEPFSIHDEGIVVSNGLLHEEIIKIINEK